jgi:hypothetical protein
MRRAWDFVVNRPIWGPFAAVDVAGALYLLSACAAIFVFTCQGGCGGVVIERFPGTSAYKVDGYTFYPLCRDTVEVVSQEIDGPEGARIAKRACEYWNEAVGARVFNFVGPAYVDFGSKDLFFGDFVVIETASVDKIKRWKKQRKTETGWAVYGSALQVHIDASLSTYSTSDGGVVPWDRTTARVKTGRCAIGGRVWYDHNTPRRQYMADTTVIHELGHILGIGHSDEHYTLMRKWVGLRAHYHQVLGIDSIERLRELYPPFERSRL